MLVSHSHRFIFIKPYKVGGTLGRDVPATRLRNPPVSPSLTAPTCGCRPKASSARGPVSSPRPPPEFYNHMTAQDIRAALPDPVWSGYRKISVVRNPFARYLSGYFMHHFRTDRAAEFSLDAVRAGLADYVTAARDWGDRDYLRIAGQPVVDEVLRFETLAADAARIARLLSYDPPAPLRHAKKVSDARALTPLPDFYTPAAIAAVIAREAWYFDRFDYPRDPALAVSQVEAVP